MSVEQIKTRLLRRSIHPNYFYLPVQENKATLKIIQRRPKSFEEKDVMLEQAWATYYVYTESGSYISSSSYYTNTINNLPLGKYKINLTKTPHIWDNVQLEYEIELDEAKEYVFYLDYAPTWTNIQIVATDMDVNTGEKISYAWCYGYLRDSEGKQINSETSICNMTWEDIQPGHYTIDITQAYNVKVGFQTHYEFDVEEYEQKIVNLDNERYLMSFVLGFSSGQGMDNGVYTFNNTPASRTLGSTVASFDIGESIIKFINYSMSIDNVLVAETQDVTNNVVDIYRSSQGTVTKITSEYAPSGYTYVSRTTITVFKSFDSSNNSFIHSSTNMSYDMSAKPATSESEFVYTPNINDMIINNLINYISASYKTMTENMINCLILGDYNGDDSIIYKDSSLQRDYPTRETIDDRITFYQDNGYTNIRVIIGKLIKNNNEYCDIFGGQDSRYSWSTPRGYYVKYLHDYVWECDVYAGFTYIAK